MIPARIISLLIGYAFGNVSMGVILGKLNHVDIQHEGSGSTGSTNVARSIGAKAALATAIWDCMKAIIPAIIVWFIYKDNPEITNPRLLTYYAAFGAVFGHMLPVVLKFKGGKGIATSLGIIIAVCPLSMLIVVTLFFAVAIATKYVSLGSVLAVGLLPVVIGIFIATGIFPLQGTDAIEVMVLFILDALISIYMHRGNIVRLMNGTERKFTIKKKSSE